MNTTFDRTEDFSKRPIEVAELENLSLRSIICWVLAIISAIATIVVLFFSSTSQNEFIASTSIGFGGIVAILFAGAAIADNITYKEELAYLDKVDEEADRLEAFIVKRYGLSLSSKASTFLLRGKVATININNNRIEVKLSYLPDFTDARLINKKTKEELSTKININL